MFIEDLSVLFTGRGETRKVRNRVLTRTFVLSNLEVPLLFSVCICVHVHCGEGGGVVV